MNFEIGELKVLLNTAGQRVVEIGFARCRHRGTRKAADMKVTSTEIADLKIIEPDLYADVRGFQFESFSANRYAEEAEIALNFVQDNHSRSFCGVLRGLHYQLEQAQGKLVRSVLGEIFDVSVDIRRSSTTFGRWVGVVLSAENRRQLWVPPGFAHGFFVLSDIAEVLYKATDYYNPEDEHCLAWNDPTVAVEWPLQETVPIVSQRDRAGLFLSEIPLFP